MISERILLRGKVHNGVIIPDGGLSLPDGATVEFTLTETIDRLPQTLADEFSAWDKAGDDSWAMIDEWEAVNCGWQAIVGTFANDLLYDEAMRLGCEWRESQRESEDMS